MSWTMTVEGGVATARFAHPPLHVADYADMEELERLTAAAAGDGARVLVLTGAEEGTFITHADLDDLDALSRGAPTSGDGSAWGRVLRVIDQGPMVTIAAVNGRAWGGGAELALTCNLRYLARGATICFPEVSLGIIPGVGAHQVIRNLPEHLALELLLGGQPIDAERAVALGLANATVDDDHLEAFVAERAHAIARRPPEVVGEIRTLIRSHRRPEVKQLQRDQLQLFMRLLDTDDARHLIARARERYAAGADPEHALELDPRTEPT